MSPAISHPYRLAVVQGAAVVMLLGVGVLMPPADGAMLLVPLTAERTATMVDLALDRGARIGGLGPLPGSLIIRGERARLFRPLLARGILAIAAPAIWCGR